MPTPHTDLATEAAIPKATRKAPEALLDTRHALRGAAPSASQEASWSAALLSPTCRGLSSLDPNKGGRSEYRVDGAADGELKRTHSLMWPTLCHFR